jgi:hypothetical protein
VDASLALSGARVEVAPLQAALEPAAKSA